MAFSQFFNALNRFLAFFKCLVFASIHPPLSLNQGQGSIFALRECVQSIPRLEKPKNRRFSHKNPKMFDFRFNTPTTFPESRSRKHFHASRMRAIDSPHKIRGNKVIFRKKLFDDNSLQTALPLRILPRKKSKI